MAKNKAKDARFGAARRWHRLDNTANLFPVITSKKVANVYRMCLTLARPVVPAVLQRALEEVLPDFAAFRVRLRRGMFWHYLDENTATPTVQAEDDYPLRAIIPRENNNYLFRVTYYECRINLEVYHVLTDGTGGLQFLQALVCRYLLLAHTAAFTPEQQRTKWFAAHAANTEDGYTANYTPAPKTTFRLGKAYRIKGERGRPDAVGMTHLYLPVDALLAHCRELGVSVTHYLTACIAWAVFQQQMRGRPPKYPLNIQVPVNLRNLFRSTTVLNFFQSIYVSLPFSDESITFEDVLATVKAEFEQKLTREAILEKISYTVGSGYSKPVRFIPLVFKNIGLRLIYESSVKSSTLSFSNLGRFELPEPFVPYIAGAQLMLSTSPTEPFKCAACSWGNCLVLSLTSALRGMELQRAVAMLLAQHGFDVVVQTNGGENENL